MLQKLDEEVRTNTYMMKDQLPKEIASKKQLTQDLQRVVAEPAMGQSDLDNINAKVCIIMWKTNLALYIIVKPPALELHLGQNMTNRPLIRNYIYICIDLYIKMYQ